MIIILAGLELTTNDVHSRLTKSQLTKPQFRPGVSTTIEDTHTVPLDILESSHDSNSFPDRKYILPHITFEDADSSKVLSPTVDDGRSVV